MKYLFKSIIALFFLTTLGAYGQKSQRELLSKEFNPNSKDTEFFIKNSFGNISIAVWDDKSIAVQVNLEHEGYDEDELDQLLKKIEIESSQSSQRLAIQTNLKLKNVNSNGKKSFKINYKIKMPEDHPLNLDNDFGNIFLNDYLGTIKIKLEYGDLTAGELNLLDLNQEFGKVYIESVQSAKLDLEYVDEFELQNAESITLKSEFSKLKIGKVQAIDFDMEYGKLAIGKAIEYQGSAEFCSLELGAIRDSFKLNAQYASGTIEVKEVNKNLKFFELDTQFSKSEITIQEGSNFRFETKHDFGKLNTKGNLIKFTKKIKDMNEEAYEGTIGNSSSLNSTLLKISTSYGGCKIIAE